VQHSYSAADGTELAYFEFGEGHPLVLLHGVMADASSWTGPGHVDFLVAAGHRVIAPDFRGHGASAKPHDATSYPSDVLASDVLGLIAHLGLTDYDLAGYSLGGRIVARALVRGAGPRRAVIGGQGLDELLGAVGRVGTQVRKIFGPGSAALTPRDTAFKESIVARGVDPVAILNVLDSLVPTHLEDLERVPTPTLVLVGVDDERAATAGELAAALPAGSLRTIPGDHVAAAMSHDLAVAIEEFLDQPDT
jgi:pimeloyl-ACP methyl ester carboxylesterase